MNSRRVTLDDFLDPGAGAHGALPDTAGAPPAAADIPVIEPEPDPQAQRNASLARLAGALETLASEQTALRAQALRDAAAALGAAAASLVPALARSGFAAMVAEAARSIAESGQWPELTVFLAPADADDIAGYLAAGAPAQAQDGATGAGARAAIRIETRDGAPAGEAVLAWKDGGARIDLRAITDAVLTEFRRKLDLLAQSGA